MRNGRTRRTRGAGAALGLLLLLTLIQGCTGLKPRHALPVGLENRVQVPGFPGVRAWADEPSESLTASSLESVLQEQAAVGAAGMTKPTVYLALSGGGADGAFGVGVLCGWTETGARPPFKLVTGISTGALIAPFAFLGPEYDALLKECYTNVTSKDIFKLKSLLTIFWREAAADSHPLAKLVARQVSPRVMAAVAREHARGRRLIVGTTQLDAQRLVLWDMGAIASRGTPEALALFRKVLLASASIPAAFPPVFIKVEAGGQHYEEMHVDGGTMAEVILYEAALKPLAEIKAEITGSDPQLPKRPRLLYIIRNSQVKPEWESVKPRIAPIAARSIATLIKNQAVGDLYRLYALAQRDGMDYHLAAIPADFDASRKEEFDREYMNKLFQLGYDLARKGFPWAKYPPFFEPQPVSPLEKPASRAPLESTPPSPRN